MNKENRLRRQTILVDNKLYRKLEQNAIDKGALFYKHLNRLFAQHLGIPLPEYLRAAKVGERNPERRPKARTRRSQRQTILVDMGIWRELRSRAIEKRIRLYKYVNALIAKNLQKKIPAYLKHKATEA